MEKVFVFSLVSFCFIGLGIILDTVGTCLEFSAIIIKVLYFIEHFWIFIIIIIFIPDLSGAALHD